MDVISKFYKDVRLIKNLIIFNIFMLAQSNSSLAMKALIARSPRVPLFANPRFPLGFPVRPFHVKGTVTRKAEVFLFV